MTAVGDETRARLLTESRDLYLDVGFARFSLREVARRSGISAPAVYRHFESKEALLREVCAEGFRIFSSYLLRALGEANARRRMAATADQYRRFAHEHPRDYRVIFMGAAEDVALAPPRKTGQREPTFQFLVDRVRECMQEGVLRQGDPDETALLVWSHVHGLVSLRLSGHMARVGGEADFKVFYEQAVDQLLSGLGR